jgi:beta-fructofuranosidase
VPLVLPDHWVWDLWTAVDDGGLTHLFFLSAPRSLGEEHRRHDAARIGHATSADLVTWDLRPRPLDEPPAGAPDDLATWTGSVVRDGDGTWWLFYTGRSTADVGRRQRVLAATSDDLDTWRRTGVVVDADPVRYEALATGAAEEHWRDPWAFRHGGRWHLWITARHRGAGALGGAAIAAATSTDLRTWQVGPPVASPAGFRWAEVPQRARVGGRWWLVFCAGAEAIDPAVRQPVGGTWAAGTDDPEGLAGWGEPVLLLGGPAAPWYAGRVVDAPVGPALLAWRTWQDPLPGARGVAALPPGSIGDPLPLRVDGDRLVVDLPDGG